VPAEGGLKVSRKARRGRGKRPVPTEENTLPCPGEAHQNAYIDNCAYCMGCTWGRVWKPVEPEKKEPQS
jgi:hypothetical protein